MFAAQHVAGQLIRRVNPKPITRLSTEKSTSTMKDLKLATLPNILNFLDKATGKTLVFGSSPIESDQLAVTRLGSALKIAGITTYTFQRRNIAVEVVKESEGVIKAMHNPDNKGKLFVLPLGICLDTAQDDKYRRDNGAIDKSGPLPLWQAASSLLPNEAKPLLTITRPLSLSAYGLPSFEKKAVPELIVSSASYFRSMASYSPQFGKFGGIPCVSLQESVETLVNYVAEDNVDALKNAPLKNKKGRTLGMELTTLGLTPSQLVLIADTFFKEASPATEKAYIKALPDQTQHRTAYSIIELG